MGETLYSTFILGERDEKELSLDFNFYIMYLMNNKVITFSLLFFIVVFLTFSCKPKSGNNTSQPEETLGEYVPPVVDDMQEKPAVFPRRNESLYERDGDNIGKWMGNGGPTGDVVTYLGETVELVTSGEKTSRFSKVRTSDGKEGWVYSFLLAIDSHPAVLMKTTPLRNSAEPTSLTAEQIPVGQVVAVSLSEGNRNGLVRVLIGYTKATSQGKLGGYVRSGYLPYSLLSVDEEDLIAAQLVSEANADPERREVLMNSAFSRDTNLLQNYVIAGNELFLSAPDENASSLPVSWGDYFEITVLASDYSPYQWGDSPRFAYYDSGNETGWVLLTGDPPVVEGSFGKPEMVEFPPPYSGSRGEVAAYSFFPGMSIYETPAKDAVDSIAYGEKVYASNNVEKVKKADYRYVVNEDEVAGWTSDYFLALNSELAVVMEETPIYKKAELTAILTETLKPGQLVAFHLDRSSGDFIELTWGVLKGSDITMFSNYYIESRLEKNFSSNTGDITAARMYAITERISNNFLKEEYIREAAKMASNLSFFFAPLVAALESKNTETGIESSWDLYVTADVGLRVRDSPGLEGEKIGLIPYRSGVTLLETQEEVVEINGVNGRWVKIHYASPFDNEEIEGWAFDGFLEAQ